MFTPMVSFNTPAMMNNEQMDIPGVPFPDLLLMLKPLPMV